MAIKSGGWDLGKQLDWVRDEAWRITEHEPREAALKRLDQAEQILAEALDGKRPMEEAVVAAAVAIVDIMTKRGKVRLEWQQ